MMNEIEELRSELEGMGRRVGFLEGILDGGTRIPLLVAETGQFTVPPFEMSEHVTESWQSIASGSYVPIEFDTELMNTGLVLWDEGAPETFVLPSYSNKALYMLYASIVLENLISSAIEVRYIITSSPATLSGTLIWISTTLSWRNYTGFYGFAWQKDDDRQDESFELQIRQFSGGAVNLKSRQVCLRLR